MKTATIAKLLTCLLTFATLSANAGVISVSGKSFDDKGNSTVDLSTSKEWRDLNLVAGRSTCSIMKDAGTTVSAGCSSFDNVNTIVDSEGWRIATRNEVAQLFTDWMGVTVSPNGSTTVNSALSTQFLSVFASGASSLNADFLSDSSNNIQGLGVYLSGTYLSTAFYTGNINGTYNSLGAFLVRDTAAAAAVPEPTPLALLGIGIGAFAFLRRRRA